MITNEAKITALIYAAGDSGITLTDLAEQIRISPAACRQLVEKVAARYDEDQNIGIEIKATEETYRFSTKNSVAELVSNYVWNNQPKHLSAAALEIVAIVAYNQPISRIEVDEIRGVNSSATLHHLQELNIIEVVGEKKEIGHPKLYAISNYGLNYFGLDTSDDLPKITIE